MANSNFNSNYNRYHGGIILQIHSGANFVRASGEPCTLSAAIKIQF